MKKIIVDTNVLMSSVDLGIMICCNTYYSFRRTDKHKHSSDNEKSYKAKKQYIK